jgi:hypothetical protein|tara:strand:+ start:1176 stop:1376 length:201 start_codon:yes stop_codon:yes gene_type:complete
MRTMFGLAANRLVTDATIEVNNNRRNFMMKVFVFQRAGTTVFNWQEKHIPFPDQKEIASKRVIKPE